MSRVVSWPLGLQVTSIEPLNGPIAIGGGTTDSLGGFTQSVSGVGFLWEFAFSFPPMKDQAAREFRSWITSLHSGSNATSYTLIDGDRVRPTGIGQAANSGIVLWSGEDEYANGENWYYDYPLLELDQDQELGSTRVRLPDSLWGRKLGLGSKIGFSPFYLGMHMITEVYSNGDYRVFPPLRQNISAGNYATLEPVVALRLRGVETASVPRNAEFLDGATAQFIEVLDYDVRDFFTGL